MADDAVLISPTARAVVVKATALDGHAQSDHPVGSVFVVDLGTRRIRKFVCGGCNYTCDVDEIDVVYDPAGPCRYPCPVEMLKFAETIH